jgi:hypothetical protein
MKFWKWLDELTGVSAGSDVCLCSGSGCAVEWCLVASCSCSARAVVRGDVAAVTLLSPSILVTGQRLRRQDHVMSTHFGGMFFKSVRLGLATNTGTEPQGEVAGTDLSRERSCTKSFLDMAELYVEFSGRHKTLLEATSYSLIRASGVTGP